MLTDTGDQDALLEIVNVSSKNYSRNGLRYQSDVTDEEWA